MRKFVLEFVQLFFHVFFLHLIKYFLFFVVGFEPTDLIPQLLQLVLINFFCLSLHLLHLKRFLFEFALQFLIFLIQFVVLLFILSNSNSIRFISSLEPSIKFL